MEKVEKFVEWFKKNTLNKVITVVSFLFLTGCFSAVASVVMNGSPNETYAEMEDFSNETSTAIEDSSTEPSAEIDESPSEISTSISEEEVTPIEFQLEVPSEIEADEQNVATITGKTSPHADVRVGWGILGDSTEADDSGNFSLTYELTDTSETTLTINASLDDESKSAEVLIKPNKKAIATAEKKEKEEKAREATTLKKLQASANLINVATGTPVIDRVEGSEDGYYSVYLDDSYEYKTNIKIKKDVTTINKTFVKMVDYGTSFYYYIGDMEIGENRSIMAPNEVKFNENLD